MDMIEVKCAKTKQTLRLNVFWLRDHCRCNKCYNHVTKQRIFHLMDLPDDVHPLKTSYSDNGETLDVKWSDGHQSSYSIEFLSNSQVESYKKAKNSSIKITWTGETIQKEKYARIQLSDLVKDDNEVRKLVSGLWQYGFAFIEGVPHNQDMTEMAVRRVFPVMSTFYGTVYTFTDKMDLNDTAFSADYIGPHTDNTYFCDAGGLQILHCIYHDGVGGENFFIDGLHVANELRRTNPKAFDILTKVLVPAEYIGDGQFHMHYAPIIRTDPVNGEIIQLRLNLYDRSVLNTLPQTEMKEFYTSFKALLELVQDPKNKWTMKLNPGTLLMYDNWRLFHARHAYNGLRKMSGCYVQRTDYLSKARGLGIIE